MIRTVLLKAGVGIEPDATSQGDKQVRANERGSYPHPCPQQFHDSAYGSVWDSNRQRGQGSRSACVMPGGCGERVRADRGPSNGGGSRLGWARILGAQKKMD